MKPFRNHIPERTCDKKFPQYRPYKPFLRLDFNRRCGYCNDLDILCGGVRVFHIDHFCPKSLAPDLISAYSNLVYACPYCNLAKSNDWPTGQIELSVIDDSGYIDPCNPSLDEHLERYDNGRIRPKTDLGKYMFQKLNLGLRRHQLAWAYEQLEALLRELTSELERFNPDFPAIEALKDHHIMLTREYLAYKNLFEETL